MTKADGFRVRRRKGGSEGRQETDWESWTDALGSLALSQSGEQKLGWACRILKLRHWMRTLYKFGFDHTMSLFPDYWKILSAASEENGDSATENTTVKQDSC